MNKKLINYENQNVSKSYLLDLLHRLNDAASSKSDPIEEELDDDAEANIMAFNRILSSIDPTVLIGMPDTNNSFVFWQFLVNKFETKHRVVMYASMKKILDKKINPISIKKDLDELILDWQNLNAVENILSESAFVLIIVTRCVGKIPHAETFTSNDEKLEIQNVFPSLIAWASSATMNFGNDQKNFQNPFVRNRQRDLKCTKCQKFGHVASNCRSTTKISNNSNPFTNKTDSENYYSNCVMSKVDELLKNNWILDSGADNHFTGDLQKLHHITEVDDAYVRTPIGTHKITHCGILNLKNSGPEFSIKVFFIPGFQSNCISLSKLKKDGYSVNYSNSNGNWTISNGDDGVTTTNVDGLTIINCNAVSKIFRPALLHRRFGHSSKFSIENCEICLLNKMKKRSFNKCPATTDDILGRIFSDICGPLVTSTEDFKYFITFIDEKSRFCGIFTIRDRSEAFRCFKQFVDWAETQTGKRVKSLLTDNAKEYRSEKFENFCLAKGIERIEIPPHTPQQNGIAERKNQSLLSMVRCMLSEKQLPMTFWSYAVREANRILNRIPSKATNMLMPYEIFYNRKPNVDNIRVFGSLVYKHIPSSNKLQPRAVPQILVGTLEKGYKLLDPKHNKISISRNVKILEDRCFDFKKHEIEIENIQNLEISIEEDNVKEDHEYSKPAMKFSNFSVKSKAAFPVPDSFEEVMNSDYKQYWLDAMSDEYQALIKHDVFEVVESDQRKLLTTKWVFNLKLTDDNAIKAFKARIVARGFKQKEGIDFDEIYSPVVDRSVIRLFLTLASKRRWKVNHIDFGNAFLNGKIDREVYVKPPAPYHEEGKCWKLKKSLYGLKQSPKIWNQTLSDQLLKFGLTRSSFEPCLFWSEKLMIIVYVDDILISFNHQSDFDNFLSFLSNNENGFIVKNLGPVNHFLGISITNVDHVFYLNQEPYIKSLAEKFNICAGSKEMIPLPSGILVDESPTEKPIRELIGGLNYVAHWTRPDICAAVNLLSRKMHHPTKGAWKSCVQILRYLLSTSDWKLKLEGKNEECEVYADADFVTDKESRASQSGIFIKIFGSPIAWSSNKQKCKSTSSSEAELIAASKAIKEATGFRNILNEVNESIKLPMTLFEDNKNCLHYLKNLCPKHIDIDRKYNEDQILRGIIKPIYLESSKQLADILTKVGGRINYKNLIPHLCLVKGGMLDDRLSIPR
uniref:Retrovirus-related Pol polyprotein from transposon TNT 1-94 n=1 Tax=Sarcoptes scabiei TaxID=52283 RepID=A0A834RK08_SARSC